MKILQEKINKRNFISKMGFYTDFSLLEIVFFVSGTTPVTAEFRASFFLSDSGILGGPSLGILSAIL